MRHAVWLLVGVALGACDGKVRNDAAATANVAGASGDVAGGGANTGGSTVDMGGRGGVFDAQASGGNGAFGGVTFDAGMDAGGCAITIPMPEVLVVLPTFELLVETSSRMGDAVDGGPSWWQGVRDGLSDFVQHPGAVGLRFGIQYFPLGGTAPASCQASYDVPAVEPATLPSNAPALVQSLDATTLAGFSPTGPALEGAISYMKARNDGYAANVILITAGLPAECAPLDVSGLATIAADGVASMPPVATSVIGLGMGLDSLREIAAAGGYSEAFLITGGDVRAQLVDALMKITGRYVPCTFTLPPPDGETPNYDLVSTYYSSYTGATPPTEIPRVAQASDCDLTNGEGWYYDDATAPTSVNLCSNTCSEMQGMMIYVMFGCRPTTAP